MRQSSSPSDDRAGLLGHLFGSSEVDAACSDAALLQAMLDAESALAQAAADADVVPHDAADAIAAACSADGYDIDQLGRDADAAGNPVVPLVRALSDQVPTEARPWVHHGATSQDILDTGLVLVIGRALDVIVPTLDEAAAAAARMVEAHAQTLQPARTLGQQAAPTTFGLQSAGWLVGLIEAADRLTAVRTKLAVQFGGPVGTLAVLGTAGPAVLRRFASRLDLAEPALPWHTDRQRVLDIAAGLGAAVAACGSIALDVTLLAQTEVGEVAEGAGEGRGGSSALPHKRNPVDATLVVAAARRSPGLVGTLFGTALHEHQRATGSWHAEWEPLRELVRLTGAAVARTRRLLDRLEVRPDRMRANLDATGGVLMAESVAHRLASTLGRTAAHDRLATLSRSAVRNGTTLRDELLGDAEVCEWLGGQRGIDDALDPGSWLGSADEFVARALATYRRRR